MEYDNYDMDEYGNLDFTEPSKDETKSTITQPQITRHGHLHTGQLSCHFFLTSDQPEGEMWDPYYTPGVDFLDHDFL